jgi:hypothetical protein
MVHGEEHKAIGQHRLPAGRPEGNRSTGELPPGDSAQADDDTRMCNGKFRFEMGTAVSNFSSVGIAIAALPITWIAAHQVGNENALEPRVCDHLPQQLSGAVAAKGNASAVAAQTARGNSNKRYIGGHATVTWNHTRAASHQTIASAAHLNRSTQPQEQTLGAITGTGFAPDEQTASHHRR